MTDKLIIFALGILAGFLGGVCFTAIFLGLKDIFAQQDCENCIHNRGGRL